MTLKLEKNFEIYQYKKAELYLQRWSSDIVAKGPKVLWIVFCFVIAPFTRPFKPSTHDLWLSFRINQLFCLCK